MKESELSALGRGICVHCRREADLTWDHVPPRAIFPGVAPSHLIEVPACFACNNGSSADDEEFRLMLSTRIHTDEHQVGRRALETALRGLARPQRRKRLHEILRNRKPSNLVSPSGVYIASGYAIPVDLPRLRMVVSRITTGLFWAETRRPLGTDYVTQETLLDYMLDVDEPNAMQALMSFASCPLKSVGNGAFRYRFGRDPNDADRTHWWMSFYDDAVAFIALTVDRAQYKAASEAAAIEQRPATPGGSS